jgi:TetR/AcrR family transcriptional regulator, transcriptional repressor for nem operon
MRYPSEHKSEVRERILTQASRAIRAQGVEKVGVATVMGAAGMTVGGFYSHFKSKNDLVAHAIEHMFRERYEHFLSLLDVVDPVEATGAFFDSYLSMHHRSHPETGCPIPVLSSNLAQLPPEGRKRLATGMEAIVTGLTRLLVRAGLARPAELARGALMEAIGALVMARMTLNPKAAEALLVEARRSIKGRLGLPVAGRARGKAH